jgi:RNA polymerase sigma-70 factor (ECF subfamily)
MVLSICRLLLVDPAEAEDAMQQAFLYAYRSLLAGSEPRRPAAWLASIARNECVNRIRARTRELGAQSASNGVHEAPDALNAAIASEDLRTLGRTIQGLPTKQREALLLHEFCGLPYGEVAVAIGVSESAIGSLLFRARSRLRSAMRRAYAAIPIPALWNAVDHLFSPGPATRIAALPVVAKLGTAAVAVGLTAGAAVVVEHDVGVHHRPPASPPAHRSEAPATAPASKANVTRTVVADYVPRLSPAGFVPVIAPARGHAVPTTKASHRAHPGRPAKPKHLALSPTRPTPSSPRGSGQPTQVGHDSGPVSAHHGSGHGSSATKKVDHRQSHGRAADKTPPLKKETKQSSAPTPTEQASPGGSGSGADSPGKANGQGAAPDHPSGPPESQQPGNGVAGNANEVKADPGSAGEGNGGSKNNGH